MAIFGLFTNTGVLKSIDAANNEGFYIYPLEFGVSDVAGALNNARTDPTAGEFYRAPLSGRVVIDNNTIKLICTIPQSVTLVAKDIKEVCLYAEDSLSVPFMLALGQPSENIIYDPSGTVVLELQIALIDIDLTANYIFNNTQATEIAEHEIDPNAHPEIVAAMAEAGIFVKAGSLPFDFVGQKFENDVEFDGTKASKLAGGVTFTSLFNGTEGNSVSLTFDGAMDVDEVVLNWNNANPNNMIGHDGVGTEVLAAQVVNLENGTYLVNEDEVVYRDVDNVFKRALADGTIKTKAVGVALRSKRRVSYGGLQSITTGFAVGQVLYLSGATAGAFATLNNGISLGIVLKSNLILFTGFSGSSSANVSETFDAVVTDLAGVNFYPTTQQAIDAVASPARILVDKLEDLTDTIDPDGKTLDIVFSDINSGWRRFAGQNASFIVEFAAVPTQGTWRIEWNSQISNDIAYNANAAAVQAEFNLFAGHTGVIVTGDYNVGFTFNFADNSPQPLPTFLDAGLNEIQRFNFSNIPDDGTIRFSYEAEETLNFPWDDNAADLKIAFEALTAIDTVNVTGSFADQFFQIEFVTNFFTDGLQPINDITVVASDLSLGVATTLINGNNPVSVPISPVVIQQGKYPASNLWDGGNASIAISASTVQAGALAGPDTAIVLDGDYIRLTGYGLVQNFEVGVDCNQQLNPVIALRFDNVVKPIVSGNLVPGQSMDTSDVLGYAKDIFSQLRLTEHPTIKKRVKISGADQILASGMVLSQEMNSLLMKFNGAEIDFETGETFENDGTTPLGLDFTPVVVASSMWRWFSLTVVPKLVEADLSLKGQVLVLAASADGASKSAAPKAPFGKPKPIGMVAAQGTFSLPEIYDIKTFRDIEGSLHLRGFLLPENATDTVAIFYDVDNTGDPAPAWALAATRNIRIVIATNDSAVSIGTITDTTIDGDSEFSSVRVDNRITVTNVFQGSVPDVADVDTGFYFEVTQQGKDLEASGLEPITNYDIKQLGTGSGGGGSAESPLKGVFSSYLDESIFLRATTNIFETDLDTKLGAGSNGAFSYASLTYDLDIGELLFSEEATDLKFKSDLKDIELANFMLVYDIDNVDTSPTIHVSRDNGQEFQEMSIKQIGDETFVARHNFVTEAANQTLHQYSVANADSLLVLNATTAIERTQEFTTSANLSVFNKITFYLNKLGAPTGSLLLNVYSDDAGNPDIVLVSKIISLASLAVGNNTIEMELSRLKLSVSTKYHIGVSTDDDYKASYNAGVDELAIRTDASAPSIAVSKFTDGATYSNSTESMVHLIEGSVLGLIFRLTASMASKVAGYAAYYDPDFAQFVRSKKHAAYVFHGTNDNLNEFFLPSDFNPDSDSLMAINIETGQTWMAPLLAVHPNKIVFPVDFFNGSGKVHLIVTQKDGAFGDASQENKLLLQESYLGSSNPLLDKSFSGRGIKQRNEGGILVELTFDENNNIVIKQA